MLHGRSTDVSGVSHLSAICSHEILYEIRKEVSLDYLINQQEAVLLLGNTNKNGGNLKGREWKWGWC